MRIVLNLTIVNSESCKAAKYLEYDAHAVQVQVVGFKDLYNRQLEPRVSGLERFMAGPAISRWKSLLGSSLLFTAAAAAKSIDISASIAFYGLAGVSSLDSSTKSYCQYRVQNVSSYGPSSIMFAPSTYLMTAPNANSSQVPVPTIGLLILLHIMCIACLVPFFSKLLGCSVLASATNSTE